MRHPGPALMGKSRSGAPSTVPSDVKRAEVSARSALFPHSTLFLGWLHHAEGHARRPSARDPCRARSEAGGGAKTASDSSAAGRVKMGAFESSTYRCL